MTINTQKLRERAGQLTPPHLDIAMLLLGAADAYDAQTAEIAEARSQIDRWKKAAESAEDRAQAAADEIDRLREAAKMLADWAEHEVGAEPDLTPGLAEVRTALQEKSND